MRYSNEEKQVAKDYIDCKIPECIKNNDFDLEYDCMEYYEALFDFAHCILNELELTSVFSNSLNDESFNVLMKLIKEYYKEENFCDKATSLFLVIKRHIKK